MTHSLRHRSKCRPLESRFWRGLWVAACVWLASVSVSAAETAPATDPYLGLWDQDPSFLFVRPEFTWGRDPFLKRPGFGPNDFAEPKWELTAVFFDGPQSEALVNGARVRIGEEIGGRIVEEIGPNYVLLTREDSVLELNLPTNTDGGSSIRLEEVEATGGAPKR